MENILGENKKRKADKNTRIALLNALIFVIIGLINIICSSRLTNILPMIIGSAMILTSGIALVFNILQKEYKSLDTMESSKNIVSIILGISILFQGSNAIPFIAIIWGISGLRKGTKGLEVVLYNKIHKNKYLLELLHALFELTISILLIYDPFEKIREHLVLLGIEMVANSLKFLSKDEAYKTIDD